MHLPILSALVTATAVLAVPRPAGKQTELHAAPHGHRETLEEAAVNVRRLATEINTGVLASVFPASAGADAGHPFAMMDVSNAPCHPNGALTFISFPISLTTRNIHADNGRTTYSLNTPVKHGISEFGQPRVAFIGNLTILEDIDEEENARLAECYTSYHPDASWWLPGDSKSAHTSHWARLDVSDLYYVGGFGNTGYIGHIPVDMYAAASQVE